MLAARPRPGRRETRHRLWKTGATPLRGALSRRESRSICGSVFRGRGPPIPRSGAPFVMPARPGDASGRSSVIARSLGDPRVAGTYQSQPLEARLPEGLPDVSRPWARRAQAAAGPARRMCARRQLGAAQLRSFRQALEVVSSVPGERGGGASSRPLPRPCAREPLRGSPRWGAPPPASRAGCGPPRRR